MMNDFLIVYDLKSCPNGITVPEIFKIAKDEKVVLWDSSLKGKKPRIIKRGNVLLDIKDINS